MYDVRVACRVFLRLLNINSSMLKFGDSHIGQRRLSRYQRKDMTLGSSGLSIRGESSLFGSMFEMFSLVTSFVRCPWFALICHLVTHLVRRPATL